MNIKLENVIKVYSGKPGCMCGCIGTYKYSTTYKDEAGNAAEISDIACKLMFNRFKSHTEEWEINIDGKWACHKTPTRNNVIYFKD